MKRILFLLLSLPFIADGQIINTVAGSGWHSPPYSGDGSQATNACLNQPANMFVDRFGNIFIADADNNVIRKVDASGIITTIAGNGFPGFTGDGGPATNAELYIPTGVVVDNSGNILIADLQNYRIRKVNTSGIITTIAGNGNCCFATDGGLADTSTVIAIDIALDLAGNIYFSTWMDHRIRKISATTGIISTVAGTGVLGFSGDGGPATLATFNRTSGLAVDDTGNIYIADSYNNRVRKVNTSGIINTIAGHGLYGGSTGDGGLADTATLDYPHDVAIDTLGNLYVTEYNTSAHRIRKINSSGFISTIAGLSGGFSGDGGPASAAALTYPRGIVCDNAGNVYVADEGNYRIRKIGAIPITYPTSNSLISFSENFSIYPNPATTELNITSPDKITQLIITNLIGQQVYTHVYNKESVQVNVARLPGGIYFIKINGSEVRRFVKE